MRFAAVLLLASSAFAQQARVLGVGGFAHVVADLDRSLRFYVDGLGLELRRPVPAEFTMPRYVQEAGNTPDGAVSKAANLRLAGSEMTVELIEYRSYDVRPVRPAYDHPGAAALVVPVDDVAAMTARLREHGGEIVYEGATSLVRDPDAFYVLLEPRRGSGNMALQIKVTNIDTVQRGYLDVLGFGGMIVGSLGRTLHASIPGSRTTVRFDERRNDTRTAQRTRFPDPGTPMLQLRVTDAAAIARDLGAIGWEIVSKGGQPTRWSDGAPVVIVRDPNNLFLQLIERVPAPSGKQ